MNTTRFVISIIALLTVTKTYAMDSENLYSEKRGVSTTSPQTHLVEKDIEMDDFVYETNIFLLKNGIYCFPKFDNLSAKYIIPVCGKVLGDPSNTSEEIANIHVHRGAAWHQLDEFSKAHDDFQIALSIEDQEGHFVLMKDVRAEVLRHIATYPLTLAKMRIHYLLNNEDK